MGRLPEEKEYRIQKRGIGEGKIGLNDHEGSGEAGSARLSDGGLVGGSYEDFVLR